MTSNGSLGQFEQLIMTAIASLENDAYGLQIYSKVCELADRLMNVGSLYVTLERLQKKGYVRSKVGGDRRQKGGRPRKYYTIVPAGEQALLESMEIATRMSETFWSVRKWKPLRPKVSRSRSK